jgi:hypothetical protein
MTYRISQHRDQFGEQRTTLFERPRSQVGAGEDEQVKSVEQNSVLLAAEVLQKVE